MNNIKFYCVTNKSINFIKKKEYNLAWVGTEKPTGDYIRCDYGDNIFYKEKFYSELTFHYWYWKNLLNYENENQWVGFCQKRRFWLKSKTTKSINKSNINDHLLTSIENDDLNFESFICDPIEVSGAKKIKLLKRGWRNILKKPSILLNKDKINLLIHFDMHHGYGNLNKAIKLLDDNDRDDFLNYVESNNQFNPHIMFISKKKIMNQWFSTLFSWLERCEKEFGFEQLKGYDTTRIYAYLSERYLSFWFKKYTKFKAHPWKFLDI
tara:strand:+ start:1152 stop:1949 length:798 start_codon:yes stop_codon:yes gene_type:complete